MAAVSAKYGVGNLTAEFPAELAEIYDVYLVSCLPQGDTPLECVKTVWYTCRHFCSRR
jgi:Chloroplast envelope transporter